MGSVREWNVELDDRIVGECNGRWRWHLHTDGNVNERQLHSNMHEDGFDHESRLYDQWT